jgi:hypothetical protein
MIQERKQFEKAQKEFINKIIDEENRRGLFNSQVNSDLNTEIPSIDVTKVNEPNLGLVNGPRI